MSMTHQILAKGTRYKKRLRKGRGESSGHGKTSGRGTKGSGARVGKPIKRGHEGGQTPIYRRLPIRGFSNDRFQRDFYIVNLADLNTFDDGATVDAVALEAAGLIPDSKNPVKILGEGDLSKKLTILAGWYSRSAFDKIAAAGATAMGADGQPFAFPKPKPKFVPRDKDAKKGGGKKEAKAEKAEGTKGEAPAKAEKAEKTEKTEKAEKVEKPEKTEKTEKAEKAEVPSAKPEGGEAPAADQSK